MSLLRHEPKGLLRLLAKIADLVNHQSHCLIPPIPQHWGSSLLLPPQPSDCQGVFELYLYPTLHKPLPLSRVWVFGGLG